MWGEDEPEGGSTKVRNESVLTTHRLTQVEWVENGGRVAGSRNIYAPPLRADLATASESDGRPDGRRQGGRDSLAGPRPFTLGGGVHYRCSRACGLGMPQSPEGGRLS